MNLFFVTETIFHSVKKTHQNDQPNINFFFLPVTANKQFFLHLMSPLKRRELLCSGQSTAYSTAIFIFKKL